jgi:tRNA pseudouridine55 synthase
LSAAQVPSDGPSGLLLVDKPEAMTSHDVVDAVRRLLGTRRVGHTGTLDPAATGLLVLCVGKAGRLQSFLTSFDKSYEGTMRFGVETDTYDREGTPVGTPHPDPRPEPDAVRAACARWVGEFEQAPPPFSAKKVGGKKFYELARKGEAVPHLPKKVRITRFDTLEVAGAIARFHVDCSSGTYIRSLAHDVGRELALGAHLATLRRTRIGPFSLERARTLPALDALPVEARTSPPSWMPLSEIPLPFPAVTLLPGEAQKVRRGHAVPVRVPAEANGAPWVRLVSSGDLVALGHLEPLGRGALALAKPKIVLQD